MPNPSIGSKILGICDWSPVLCSWIHQSDYLLFWACFTFCPFCAYRIIRVLLVCCSDYWWIPHSHAFKNRDLTVNLRLIFPRMPPVLFFWQGAFLHLSLVFWGGALWCSIDYFWLPAAHAQYYVWFFNFRILLSFSLSFLTLVADQKPNSH